MKNFAVYFFLLLSFPLQLFAIDLTGYKFSDSYRYSFLEDSGIENFSGKYLLTTSFAHIATPFFITDSQSAIYRRDLISSNNLITVGGKYLISPQLKIGLGANIERVKTSSDTFTDIGDTYLQVRYTVKNDSYYAFSLNPEITIPTGKVRSFTTRDSIGASLRAVFEKKLNGFFLLASAGYSYASKNQYQIVDYRNLALFELGLSTDINEYWNVNFEINRNFTIKSDKHQDEGDYYLTFKNKTTSALSTYGGLGVAGFNDVDKNNWTLFAGLKYNFPEERKVTEASHVSPKEKTSPVIPTIEKPIAIKTPKDEKALGPVFKIENIYFENAKIDILPIEMLKIEELQQNLKKEEKRLKHIVVEGFASKVGNPKKNQKLSLERAMNVQNKLIEKGIPKELISIIAYGDSSAQQFKDVNKNRRVQFRVYLSK